MFQTANAISVHVHLLLLSTVISRIMVFLNDSQARFMKDGSLGSEPVKETKQRQEDFFKSLCKWIIDAGMPFSTIENRFFNNMIACADPTLVVPC